jgi:transglutaminase-like putative cysteine protease
MKVILLSFLLLILACGTLKFWADVNILFAKDRKEVEVSGAATIFAYSHMVITNDAQLRDMAENIAAGCKTNACVLYRIYLYIMNNYEYIPDPDGTNIISGINITMRRKGGDCEDLTFLLASLLENMGIPTELAAQPDHVYLYACEIDRNQLLNNIRWDKRFYGYAINADDIFETEIDGKMCIPVDPSLRGDLMYPGIPSEEADNFIISPSRK